MSFALAEFSLEAILREGLDSFRDSDMDLRITDIFGRLKYGLLNAKYGQAELDKISEVLSKSEINFVHSLSQLANSAKFPAISIQLVNDTEEDREKAIFNDFTDYQETPIDPQTVVPSFNASSYNSTTGMVRVGDSVNLSSIYAGMYWKDGTGNTHTIANPISSVLLDKYFHIETGASALSLIGTTIVSSVSNRVHEVKMIPSAENLMVGIHSENSLLTRYLYYVIRYVLWARKNRFQELGLELVKYDGTDFNIGIPMLPEPVYSRFVTVRFTSYNYFRDIDVTDPNKELVPVDSVQPSMGGDGQYESLEEGVIGTTLTYDPATGVIAVLPDTVDLSDILLGRDFFYDSVGSKFKILEADDTAGTKFIRIQIGQTVDLSGTIAIRRKSTMLVIAESNRVDGENYDWETEEE